MKYTCKQLKQISRGALARNWLPAILAYALVSLIVSLVSTTFEQTLTSAYLTQLYDSFKIAGMEKEFVQFFGTVVAPDFTELIIAIAALLIISLVSMVLTAGQYKMYLCFLRNEKTGAKEVFMQFKNRPDRYIIASFLLMLLSIACMIPVFACGGLSVYFALTGNEMAAFIASIAMVTAFIGSVILVLYFMMRFSQVCYLYIDNPDMNVLEAFKESSRIMKGNMWRYLYMILSFIPLELLAGLTMGIGAFFLVPYMGTVQAAFYMDVNGEFRRREEEARRLDEEMGPVLSE